jgi:transposase
MARREHQCEWKERHEALAAEHAQLVAQHRGLAESLSSLQHDMEKLKRHFLGPKSEKMPRVADLLRKDTKADPEQTKRARAERAAARKAKLETKTTIHSVPKAKRHCPQCGGNNLKPLGTGKQSIVYEYVPAHFIAHKHLRETLVCPCGGHVVTAEGPPKWVEKSQYAPSFVASVITSKCADSIPLYRLEKELERIGVPVARSTLTDLFHRAAEQVGPLVRRMEELVREALIVRADETSKKMMAAKKCHTGFIWTFRTRLPKPLIVYRFAASRSGETPRDVLGGTKGYLVVDAYSGYNDVVGVDGRTRVGCHAHLRRYFFEAKDAAPEASYKALDFILGLYRVEHDARERGILGTQEHLELRRTRSSAIRAAMKTWLESERPNHAPKSPMGAAIRYALNQWDALGVFLEDPNIPLDNNESESALRRVALGRKNFLFVGNETAGENLAGLYSLVASCEANDINPVEYLTDVLGRLNDHPNSRLDELLPHLWHGPPTPSAVLNPG